MTTLVPAKQLSSVSDLPEAEHPPKEIIVYVCPRPGCSNYYAAPNFRPDRADIEGMQYHRSSEDGSTVASHSRTECPYCRAQGLAIERVPYVVTEVVSLNKMRSALKKRDKAAKKAAKKKGVRSEPAAS